MDTIIEFFVTGGKEKEMEFQYQLFPDLTQEEYKALKDDIRQRGVLVPVEIDDSGNILDGHHRIKAWNELKAEGVSLPDYVKIIRKFENEAEKRNHVRALNILRRHLSKEQVHDQWQAMRQDGMTYQAIADASGVSEFTVRNTVSRNNETQPPAITGKDGKQYPPTKKPSSAPQETVFDLAGMQTEKDVKREAQKQERAEMHASKRTQAFPVGKYAVIYADPPWKYDNSGFDEAADAEYPTMPVDEICSLPVQSLASDGSILFLWATNPLLQDAIKVISAWGFEYKTNMAWIKDMGRGKGWYLKSKHELLLIGTREGTPHPETRPDSCFESPRGNVHSKKPELAYEIIESMYPGNKIELFSRQPRKGWEAWGNE